MLTLYNRYRNMFKIFLAILKWNKFNSLPKMVKLLPKKKYDKLRVNLLTDLDNRYQKWLNHYQF
jgi:hypothetical protein